MSKTRKQKVAKLSDEDYGNYIMSLKDERPTKVIVNEKEDKLNNNKK